VTDSGARALLAQRCAAQLLSGRPARSAVEVVRHLLAVQGQDPRGARLAIRARSAGLTAGDVDRALTQDRSLLITWLNRGTLHLVTVEDYWWLQELLAPRLGGWNGRRLAQEGVSADDAEVAVGVIDAALAQDGPLTRAELTDRVRAAGVPAMGQGMPHLLLEASMRGMIVRGPVVGRHHAMVRVGDWLGERPARFAPDRFDRDVALAELARRYLVGHGPAGDRDLAKWTGLPLRDVRRGLAAIAGELRDRSDGLAELAHVPGREQPAGAGGRRDQMPPPRLLGPFDPLLHGWADREPVLGDHTGVVTVNGLFRAFALVDGRAVATWGLPGGVVALSPFGPLAESVAAALDEDARDVVRFLGL
jgi:Winged helix DNA-binding domain